MTEHRYDLCIIGAGMTGSAAARHASANKNTSVCLIGPAELKERKLVTGKEVFGGYFDESRITRSTSSIPVWGILAQRSIFRYRQLENESGIKFYHEVGALMVGPRGESFITQRIQNAKDQGILDKIQILDNKTLRQRFRYLEFAENDVGLLETTDSGYINPRKLVAAQTILASKQGCDIIRDIVTGVVRQNDRTFRIVCQSGRLIRASKVLLATSTFTGLHNLLGNEEPECELMPQTLSFGEVPLKDVARLKDMPAVVYQGKGGPSWPADYPRDSNGDIHFYMLPPVVYPGGNHYIKIGHDNAIVKRPLKLSEVQRWYCDGGDPELESHMFKLMQSFFTDVSFKSHYGDSCVTMVTPTSHPYIDLVTPTLGVVMGDNGLAAKSSDEIGRVAADMIICSKWTYDLPWEYFRLISNRTTKRTSNL